MSPAKPTVTSQQSYQSARSHARKKKRGWHFFLESKFPQRCLEQCDESRLDPDSLSWLGHNRSKLANRSSSLRRSCARHSSRRKSVSCLFSFHVAFARKKPGRLGNS